MQMSQMVKKLFFVLPLVLVSVAVGAFTWNDPYDPYTGPYIGADIGASAVGINQTTVSQSGVFPSVAVGASGSYNLSALGVEGGLFAGYGHRWAHHLYTGAEVYGMFNSANATANNQTSAPNLLTVSERVKGTFGASFDPGFFITPDTLAYLAVGPTFAVFNSKSTTGDGGLNGSSNTFTKTLVGGRFGGGFETTVYKNLNVRAEYDYSYFPSFNESSQSLTDGTVNTTYKPYSNEVLFSLIYHL